MLSRPMIASMCLVVVVFVLALFVSFRGIYAELSRYEKSYLQSRADYVSLGVGRVMEHTLRTINRVAEILAVYPEGFSEDNRYMNSLLTRIDTNSQPIEGIFVVGPDGVIKTESSLLVPADKILLGQPFFDAHFSGEVDFASPFIGAAFPYGDEKKRYIPVSSAVVSGPTIQAIIVAFVDTDFLEETLYLGSVSEGEVARLFNNHDVLIDCLGMANDKQQATCEPESISQKEEFFSPILNWLVPGGYQTKVQSNVDLVNLFVTLHEPANMILQSTIGVVWRMIIIVVVCVVTFGICLWVIWRQKQSWRENESRWKRKSKRLLELAMTDPLTGLNNRRSFEIEARRILLDSAKNGLQFGVMLIDADHFKKINDEYGHATGDIVLQELAKMLKSNTRETDIAGRIGGEEFAIVSPDISPEGLNRLARRILLKTRMLTIDSEEGEVSPTVSIGMVHVPKSDTHHDIIELMSKADDALYRAKEAGRDCLKTEKV
ncbi:hypothetical protein C9939_00965 [Pseudidiomarina aestuarii]|nr:hypothetical protein C9939_00965 [Pseudidiomarina aestuarii]